jgi:hypothetical protein
VIVLGLIALAIIVNLASGDEPAKASDRAAAGSSSDSKQESAKPTPPPVLPTDMASAIDRDTRFKALVHDLENGKTCTDRKAAVHELAELGDERAIAPLKKARYRMRGGLLGVGDSNTNGCLKADAEAAIKELGGSVK